MIRLLAVFVVWLPLIYCGSLTAEAEENDSTIKVQLKQHRDVFVCGKERDRRFEFSVGVGEIDYLDSLYSFDVLLKYNPDKIQIISALYIGTLSDYFDYKDFNIWEPGELRAFAMQFYSPQVSGDKPLIAFMAKYLGECPDTTYINTLYFEIEVVKEMEDGIEYKDSDLKIDVKVKETDWSFVEAKFLSEELKFGEKDSVASGNVNLNTNGLARVDSLTFKLNFNEEVYELLEARSLNEKFVVDTIYSTKENEYFLKSVILDDIIDETVLQLEMKARNVEDTSKLSVEIVDINDCSCATRFVNDELVLIKEKEDTTGTDLRDFENNDINIDSYYSYLSEEFVYKIDGGRVKMKSIRIYDLNGRELAKAEYLSDAYYAIDVSSFSRGVYLTRMTLMNDIVKNIFLIKN